jgi:diguanylate cyclase (GGDEF)-like protein
MAASGGDWATQQLGEFLALFATFDDERSATPRMVERAAEMLDADGVALIDDERVLAATGPPAEVAGTDQLRDVVEGRRRTILIRGRGEAHAVPAPVDDEARRALVFARASEPFAPEEVDLLRGIGRVMALGLRTLNLVGTERALRADSENQADENAKLLVALRERQVLLERLSVIQRSIVGQRALHEIFDQVIEAGCELLGDEVGLLRLRDADSKRTTIAASLGLSQEFLAARRRTDAPGIGTQAMAEGGLVVVDKNTDSMVRRVPSEWAAEGLRAGIAAPVFERAEIVGSLGIASRDPNRAYSPRDQQVMLALAEHTSLALNHARALDDVVHEAFHDSLTGMPNRTLFLDRVSHALARAERTGAPVGVLVVDLDDFKTINDSLGHGTGDALLVEVAGRLAARLRPADTIARLGGDEFAVLLEDVSDPDDAARAAGRVLDALSRPFAVADREVAVNGSVGIAVGNYEAETLLRDADLAMYRAKGDGKGGYEAFEPRMHTEILERLELEVELKGAIQRGELSLVYQPIFSLRTGLIAGLEALVRWRHPTRGMVPPDRFVPLAERSGAINDLGRWVLATACHQGALWRAKYPAMPGIQVGVNLSVAQLRSAELVAHVSDALETARLDPEGLTLEITETALMSDLDIAVRRLDELKGLGIEIAIDDFGTGHSSLRYLQRLPLDNLKIAKPFVDEIENPDPSPRVLRAVLDLADVFNLRPVAEGIERAEQSDRLLELGCELGQGHHLSEPIAAAEADDLILRTGLLGGSARGARRAEVRPRESAAGPAGASRFRSRRRT